MAKHDNHKDYAGQVAQTIIEHLEAGTAPWQKEWLAGEYRQEPHNPKTGQAYRGINNLMLSMSGYADPRWMTYRQAADKGYQVRKGEKSTAIEYWKWTDTQKVINDNGEVQKDEDGKDKTRTVKLDKPRVFYARVFNGGQIEGIEPHVVPEPPEDGFEPHKEAEHILASLGVPVKHDQGDRAYYHPMKDEIHLPPKGQFTSKEGYYSTALHELGHATGHPSRLDRRMSGGFGSQNYAREELRAEIASYMLNTRLGIGHDPAPHASYVRSWIKALKEDPREIFRAARDADVIQTYLREPELRQKLEQSAQNIEARQTERIETMHNRQYIKIDFEDQAGRAEVRALGARYDGKAKSWYIPEGKEAKDFARFPAHDPLNKLTVDPEVSFSDFLNENGFAPKGELSFDGEWHDLRLQGQKGGKASGSYKVFDGAIKTIVAQNHKTGEQYRLTHTGQELTIGDRKAIAEQREENRKLNEQLRQENHDKAAQKAQVIIGNLQSASADHPYLVRKGVQPFCINQT